MNNNVKLNSAMMAAAVLMGVSGGSVPSLRNGVSRSRNPWDGVQLSKAERKGKTPDELQALRRAKWEADHA